MAWKSGQSYAVDLRSRVLAAVDGGSPVLAVAARFEVGVSYVYKALGRRDATGETEARPRRDHQELELAPHHAAITAEVTRRSDVTLDALRAWLLAIHGVAASPGLMRRTLLRLGPTLKKSRSGPRRRTGPTAPGNALNGGADRASRTPRGWCSWTRPVRPPTWPGATAAARAAGGSTGRCRTATGRARPSSAG